jgi:tryptophan-rich sensory protein
MVRATEEAALAAAEQAFRAGVDRPLSDDAVAGWLIWRKAGFAGAGLPLAVYALQLILNAAWSPLFFGLHRPDLGFVDIVLVWMSIIATIVLFYPIHVVAALLLVPYLAWVTFATALNFAVWRLNSVESPRA